MTPAVSYSQFIEDLLVRASRNVASGSKYIDEASLLDVGYPVPEPWKNQALDDLWQQRYVDCEKIPKVSDRVFKLNSLGLLTADKIVSERKSVTLRGRLAAVPRSDWIAAGAFITSILALLK